MSYTVCLESGQRFECDGERSVLDGMMARGRTGITVGCRGGGCGVCKVRVTHGRYRTGLMSAACVTAEERDDRVALACKLIAESDLELVVLGKIERVISRFMGDARSAVCTYAAPRMASESF